MIITKPRQLRIDLDPDAGFPVSMKLECRRLVVEDGQELMELPAEIITLVPGSPEAAKILDEVTAKAIDELKTYQNEVQRLAAQLYELKEQPAGPTA